MTIVPGADKPMVNPIGRVHSLAKLRNVAEKLVIEIAAYPTIVNVNTPSHKGILYIKGSIYISYMW